MHRTQWEKIKSPESGEEWRNSLLVGSLCFMAFVATVLAIECSRHDLEAEGNPIENVVEWVKEVDKLPRKPKKKRSEVDKNTGKSLDKDLEKTKRALTRIFYKKYPGD